MRLVSAAEAVSRIASREQLFIHAGAATPTILLDALIARAPELEDVRILSLHTEGPDQHLAPEYAGHFRHRALFIGPMARQAVNEGRAEYIPVLLSDVPGLFRDGHLPLDAALLNVAAPDAHGYCSLGTSVDAALAAARSAGTVMALINTAMPRTMGEGFLHVSEIDLGVEVDAPPYEVPAPPVGPVEWRIGEHIAALVSDGATLQTGIGAIPAALGEVLRDKRDLGIHSEMVTDLVVDLVEAGAINGSRKGLDRGRIVTSILLGTRRLYDFAHDNPAVQMRPIDYTNDTSVIRRLARMTAINSAIEIDLSGQVVADSIGWRLYSGVGGQMDFMRGAALAPEGRAIIALPSTADSGRTSRIVPTVRPGAGVVTTRAHVRTVVTEHGVAELYGRSLAERARALIAIAHPDFRDELERAAREHPTLDPGGLPPDA